MSQANKESGKGEIINGEDIFEIAVDEKEKSKYMITIPLSYDFEFSPVNDEKSSVNVSTISVRGTDTIITTPGATSQWKLRIMKLKDRSSSDETGKSSPPDGDESGDFIDWLRSKDARMEEPTRSKILAARRSIVFQKE